MDTLTEVTLPITVILNWKPGPEPAAAPWPTAIRLALPTELLLAWGAGDKQAFDLLVPLVHDELRRLARGYMARERPDHTLQASALVNEAYCPVD